MGEGEIVRVLIADDHPLVVGGLKEAVLAAIPGAEISVAHVFDSMAAALEKMREAIVQVLDGERWTPPDFDPNAQPNRESSALARRLASLTPQQIRVLMMLSQGLLNKQIAYELSVSEATVKAHVSAILQKLGVESRTQAVILATKIESAQELLIPSK